METQGVQEALEHVHAEQHAERDTEPGPVHEVQHDAVGREGHLQAHGQGLLEEHQRELLMRQRERPDTEVRRGVRNCTEHELDGLDDLVDEDLAELELLAVAVTAVALVGRLLVLQKTLMAAGLLLLRLVVLPEEDEGLREEHDRHREDRVHHQRLRHLHGAVPEGELVLLAHGHADEGVDDARGIVDGVDPLVEDHPVHPAEEAEEEDHHREALADKVHQVLRVEGVGPAQEHADEHLQHAEEHGELHLHRVDEQQLVGGADPRPVHADGVGAGTAGVRDVVVRREVAVAVLVLEAGLEQLEADREEVVVHEARVHREDAQAEHHVPRREEHGLSVAQVLRIPDQPDAEHEQQGAVTDVSVHHPEDEREGDRGEKGGIRLLVGGDAVGVDHVLEGLGVVVRADVRGRHALRRSPVRGQEGLLRGSNNTLLEQGLDLVLVQLRVPDVHAQREVSRAHVQDRVDGLLLHAEEAPVLDLGVRALVARGHQVGRLGLHEAEVRLRRPRLLREGLLQGRQAPGRGVGVGGPGVDVDAEARADLLDLLLHRAGDALEVDNEHRLVHDHAVLRVGHLLLDGAELGEGVAAGRPPEGAREAGLVRLRHDAGQVAQPPERVLLQDGPLRAGLEVLVQAGRQGRRRAGAREDLQGSGHDLGLLHRLVLLGHQGHVVLLELDELRVELLERDLHVVELVGTGVVQEVVHVVLLDRNTGDAGELVEEEPQDALHLVNALDVLLVRAGMVARVHVLELQQGAPRAADQLDELLRVIDRQHERAVLHRLRPQDPHGSWLLAGSFPKIMCADKPAALPKG
mmetsp:Transcript_60123/g.158157  ORF Transcript_60123/g.158157 Transcript_60123/m.158157 type:complete len:806 (+) Transcript_60123:399-2816(+)